MQRDAALPDSNHLEFLVAILRPNARSTPDRDAPAIPSALPRTTPRTFLSTKPANSVTGLHPSRCHHPRNAAIATDNAYAARHPYKHVMVAAAAVIFLAVNCTFGYVNKLSIGGLAQRPFWIASDAGRYSNWLCKWRIWVEKLLMKLNDNVVVPWDIMGINTDTDLGNGLISRGKTK